MARDPATAGLAVTRGWYLVVLNYLIPFVAFLGLYFALQRRTGGPIQWRPLAAIVGFALLAVVIGALMR